MLRRIISLGAAVFAILLFTTTAAFAGNGHFISNATSASSSGSTLTVKFKEAGLQSGATETITISAHLDATYKCINGGGKNPSDPKKTTINSTVSQSGEFTAAKNGNLTGSLSVSAPAASSVLDCPGGQTATLMSVTWTNVSISDADSGAFLAIPGTY
ncbi:MAG: hypothetical protein H7288_12820 [Kineosporiaceae bacterium]|nr:hypothetical protein [Aeromicrobium sp.]